MTWFQPVDWRRETRPARYVRTRVDADRRPWRVIVVALAAAGVAAWGIGFLSGLLVMWFGSR
jgi:anti-sigma-K factor RskA